MKMFSPKQTAKASLFWEPEAEQALKRVPVFIRPLVRSKVWERVAAQGRGSVSLADFREAEKRFRSLATGKPGQELEPMLPRPNQEEASLVVLQSCRAGALGCPNTQMNPEPWVKALENWAENFGLSEKLRSLVTKDRILFHHKLKFSISGCANGCSRPQIVDFGLRGRVRPKFDLEECTSCGACARACPDGALVVMDGWPDFYESACQGCFNCSKASPAGCITLNEPEMELMVGGRLGRHPRLARSAGLFKDPAQMIAAVQEPVERYLGTAAPGQRFADFITGLE